MRDFNFPNGRLPLVAALDIEDLDQDRGWDFLAERDQKKFKKKSKKMREEGMHGGDFEGSLRGRFDLIKPTPEDIEMLQKHIAKPLAKT